MVDDGCEGDVTNMFVIQKQRGIAVLRTRQFPWHLRAELPKRSGRAIADCFLLLPTFRVRLPLGYPYAPISALSAISSQKHKRCRGLEL